MRRCPNCNEELQDYDKVCTNCGAFLDVVPEQLDEEIKEEEPVKEIKESKKNRNLWNQYPITEERPKEKQEKKRKFYWKLPILLLIIAILFYTASKVTEIIKLKDNILPITKIFKTLGIISGIGTIPSLFIVILIFLIKRSPSKLMEPREILNANASPTEQRRMAYVGNHYVKISRKKFSIPAFIGNVFYVIYRKRYLLGLTGVIILILLIGLSQYFSWLAIILIIYVLLTSFLLGFTFNKKYLIKVTKKAKKIRDKKKDLNAEEIIKVYQKKGGTDLFFTIIILVLFIIISLILNSMVLPKFPKKEKKEEIKVDTLYISKKENCKAYSESVSTRYQEENKEIHEINCYLGDEKYLIFETIDLKTNESYIAKYNINQQLGQLSLINTTQQLDELKEKKLQGTIQNEELTDLTEKEKIENEFNEFDEKIKKDQEEYKKDNTYVRNYIKIKLNK